MGQLKGRQWNPRDLAEINYDAGWTDVKDLVVSLCVELAESQGFDHAINVNPDGSRDRGVWQLNSIHKNITDEIAYDPVAATDEAYSLYKSRDHSFGDWYAYTNGIYLHDSYIGRACVGVANFLGAKLLAMPVPDSHGVPYEHSFTTPIANFQFRLVECLTHSDRASVLLGWQAAPKTKVDAVQKELAKARTVAKNTLPGR